MHLRDLPNDILYLVLRESLIDRYSVAATLKASLPLLAVCRRWRHIALPILHSGVFIQHGDAASWGIGFTGSHSHGTDDDKNAKTTTNLDLVVTAGCVHAVKRVDISVHCRTNPFPGLCAAIRLMHTAAEKWKSTRRLTISIHPNEQVIYREGIRVVKFEGDIERTCAALAAAMPAVRSVCFGGYYNNPVARVFYGELAALYSDQLQRIDARCPVSIPLNCTFEQLRAVSIYYQGGISHRHLRMDFRSIVSLTLANWPLDHPWAPFGPDNRPGAIVFSSLKALNVTCNAPGTWVRPDALHPDGPSWTLHFPNLDRLDVYCTQYTCPPLERAVFPQHMDSILIYAKAPVLQLVSGIGLPAARRLGLGMIDYEPNDSAALAAINRILADARGSEEVVLDIGHRNLLPVLPGLLACTSLSALSISSPVDASTMLRLVQGLPNLASLTLSRLKPDSVQGDVSVPEPGNSRLAEPFDAKLKTLRIHAYCREQQQALLIPALKTLLIRTPTLAVFDSRDVPEGPIMDFVDAYSAQYPHLAAIDFRFQDSGK